MTAKRDKCYDSKKR